jgi:hypothetical protein
MRLLSASPLTCVAIVVLLSGCGGGGSSPAPPTHGYWAADINVTNNSTTCASVSFYQSDNGGAWFGPSFPDSGPHLKAGAAVTTEFTYFPSTYSAQYRVVAKFFAHKNCSGSETQVQA